MIAITTSSSTKVNAAGCRPAAQRGLRGAEAFRRHAANGLSRKPIREPTIARGKMHIRRFLFRMNLYAKCKQTPHTTIYDVKTEQISRPCTIAQNGFDFAQAVREGRNAASGFRLVFCQARIDGMCATAGLSSSAETRLDKPTVAPLVPQLPAH